MNIQQIRSAKPNTTIWDKEVKGLMLRTYVKGNQSFLVYYRTRDGIQRRPKIGSFGQITLAQAREIAREIYAQVALGADPKGNWDKEKAEPLVSELYAQVLSEYWDKPRFEKSGRLYSVKNLWKNHLEPKFGNKKHSKVTIQEVKIWHSSLADKPYAANRGLEVLSRIFFFAEEKGIRPQGTNPCSLVSAHPEKKRGRYASEDELKRIIPILEREAVQFPNGVAFLFLMMLTGSRPRAIERATWDQLKRFKNRDGKSYGVLTFHGKTTDTTGQHESVILPPVAMDIIDRLPRSIKGSILNCKFPKRLWLKIRDEAKCDGLWARDFRRTFASVGKNIGVHMDTIGDLLNHQSTQTTKTYAKLFDDSRLEAVTRIEEKFKEIMGGS